MDRPDDTLKMPHTFPLLYSSSDWNNIPWADKMSVMLRFVQNLDTSVAELKCYLLDPYPGRCRPGIAPPKARFSSGKKSLDCSRAKKIYSSWRCMPTLHVIMCVWIGCFACPRQTKESHLLTVIHWPFLLSLKQYVSPIRFPNLHH